MGRNAREKAQGVMDRGRGENGTLRLHETVKTRPLHVFRPRPAGAPLAPATPEPPERRIGRFVIEAELGRGGMGVVYRARDPRLARPVALKVIRDPSRADRDELARFEREARAIARLKHPGIVSVYETGDHEGEPFIAMELVPGESFEALLRRGPLAPKRVAEIVRQVALALAHAHEHGVVHRDMKPANILVDQEGAPHVLDFGLARSEGAATQLTLTGELLGTPAYMAPEQASGVPGKQEPRTDVYALGAILYRALTGRLPFEAENPQALLYKVLTQEPLPPRKANPGIHADLETITLRSMAKEPERRYGSAKEVAEELRRFLDGEPIVAKPAGLAPRAWRRARRNPRVLLLAAALGLATLAVRLVHDGNERREAAARELARKANKQFPQSPDDAIDTASAAIELDPKLALAWAFRGAARIKKGELDLGIQDSTRAIALDPNLGQAWANRGIGRASRGDLDGAIADATEAIAHDPELALGWDVREGVRLEKGDLDGAIKDATEAIKRDPLLVRSFANRGAARDLKGDVDGAIADTTRALELDPAVAPAFLTRGAALCKKGEVDRAIEDTTRAIELDPRLGQAWAVRGGARYKKRDIEGALEDATRAIELDPKLAEAWATRGAARNDAGDRKGAIADATRAIELDPKHLAARVVRGVARLNERDFDGAIEDATEAMKPDPKRAVAWRIRGLAREGKGDLDGAKADLARFLELEPNGPGSDSARAALERLRHAR